MKRFLHTILYLLAIHVGGLLLTTLLRTVQYLSLHDMIADGEAPRWPAWLRGVWFDNVVGCYVLLVPLVVLLVAGALGYYRRWLRRVATWWAGVLYAVVFAVSAANIPYFQYFFKNINSGIFGWFGYAGTTAGMVTGESAYWPYIALWAACMAAMVGWLTFLGRRYDQMLRRTKRDLPHVVLIGGKLLLAAALVALCLFGIRGRMGYNPIKVSQSYYCGDAFLNQLGISPTFNLLTSVLDDRRRENQELHLMPYGEAIGMARSSLGIVGPTDSAHVLRRTMPAVADSMGACRPNVVVILMESMSARLMQTFGQEQRLTPTLDSLYHHSLAFSHFYSAGIHTNHGMTAALYSFPALMFRNLMKGTVTPRREGIPTVLHQLGYRNLFFMTHEVQYDNMKAFFSTNGYDEIYAQEDYPREERVNAFGVSDHFLFDYALPVLRRKSQEGAPFMATLLTISNHPPYIVPAWFHPHSTDSEQQIVEYADWCIGDFLRKAQREPWYRNTVFVVMADHGKIVGRTEGELPESYNHIPLMIFGPGIPTAIHDGLGQQVDLQPTLLGLLGIGGYDYEGFGIDLLRQQRKMVFYSADNQVVARNRERLFIYNPKMERAFCYRVKADGHLAEDKRQEAYGDLRRYAFAMIQTAEYMLRNPTQQNPSERSKNHEK